MKPKHFIVIVIAIYVLLQIGPGLTFLPGTDEGYYSNPLRNFIYEGNIGSSVSYSYLGFDRYCYYVFPAFLFLELLTAPLGYHLYSLRLLMLGVSIGFLLSLYAFSKTWFESNKVALITLCVGILDLSLLRIGRTIRPEILVLFFLCISLYFCSRGLKAQNKKIIFLSGLLGGLGLASHPIGIMIGINCLILLFCGRKIFPLRQSFFSFSAGFLVIIVFMSIFYVSTDLNIFFTQMKYMNYNYAARLPPLNHHGQLYLWFHNLKHYYEGYRLPEIITLSFLSLFFILTSSSKLWKPILICMFANLIFLIFLYPNKFTDYTLTLQLPYLLILTGASVYKAFSNRKIIVLCLAGGYLVFSLGAAIFNTYRSTQYGLYGKYKKQIRQTLPEGKLVNIPILGNPQYLFAFPEAHIIDCEVIRDMMDYGQAKTWEEAWESLNLKYVIADDYFTELGEQWPIWPAFTDQKNLLNYLQKKATPLKSFKQRGRSITIYSLSL